jgi:sirohydrochlorin cobaltochelatase
MSEGLLLFAHGARDPAWARPFEVVSERLRAARPATPLAMAYLEFMSPGIEEAAEQLVAAGST